MAPGEIYFAEVYQAGLRPVIVVSRESLNRGNYVVAVPLTSMQIVRRKALPNCVPFTAGEFGLPKDCVAQFEAILTIEHSQIDTSRGPIGTLDAATLRSLIRAIGFVIESDCEPE